MKPIHFLFLIYSNWVPGFHRLAEMCALLLCKSVSLVSLLTITAVNLICWPSRIDGDVFLTFSLLVITVFRPNGTVLCPHFGQHLVFLTIPDLWSISHPYHTMTVFRNVKEVSFVFHFIASFIFMFSRLLPITSIILYALVIFKNYFRFFGLVWLCWLFDSLLDFCLIVINFV